MTPLSEPAAEPVGLFHTWWRGDLLPDLPAVPGLTIAPVDDERLLGDATGIGAREIGGRMRRGHRPRLARIEGEPVGWGWVAAGEAAIGELGIAFATPPGDRYLWDFLTLPPWRGRRIYPRLLQTIIAHEVEADRFWMGHDMANVASARGIARAGFQEIGTLHRRRDGSYWLVPCEPGDRAVAGATLFDVAIVGDLAGRTA